MMIGLSVLSMFLTVRVTGILSTQTIPLVKVLTGRHPPWYSIEGLGDIANLHDKTLAKGHQYTMELSSR